MKKKISGKTIFNLIVLVLSLGMLSYFCLSENGLADLLKNAGELQYGWLIMAVVCHLLNLAIDAYMIYIFTRNSMPTYRIRDAIKSSMVGQFFSAITPFSTGGQPMQIYVMSKQGISPGISTSALVQKFLVYQTTIVTYSAIAMLLRFNYFDSSLSGVMWGFAVFGFISQALVIIGLLVFSFNHKITHIILVLVYKLLAKLHIIKNPEEKIESLEAQLSYFHNSNRDLYKNRGLLLKSYVCTAVQLTSIFIIPYCIYRSFNLNEAPAVDMICSQAFVTMASCFIPLPGAAGASEVSFIGFFSSLFSDQFVKSAVLLWRIITFYGNILLTAPFSRFAKQKDTKEPTAL